MNDSSDACATCGHERLFHNHPDCGQCTEIVKYHGRGMPDTCECEGFVQSEFDKIWDRLYEVANANRTYAAASYTIDIVKFLQTLEPLEVALLCGWVEEASV